MPVTKRLEVDVGVPIMGDFKRRGFKCYSEVAFNGVKIDLVCVQGEKVTIVEAKKYRSVKLLKQVLNRQKFSHNTVAATLKASSPAEWFTQPLIDNDIGYMTVDRDTLHCDYPIQPNGNNPNRNLVADLLNTLRKEHQEFAPPGSQGGSFTQENKMYRDIQELVAKAPESGVTIDEILAHIRIRSTSRFGIFGRSDLARDGIIKAWKLKKLPGVTMIKVQKSRLNLKRITKVHTFFPKEVAA